MAKLFWAFFLVIVLASSAAFVGHRFMSTAPSFLEIQKTVEIPQGASFRSVVDLLYQENLITNRLYFNLLARWAGNDKKIKSGEYALHTAMRPMEILDALVAGRVLVYEVVIPEGVTSRQVGKILEEAGFTTADEFFSLTRDLDLIASLGIEGTSLEGYLFPETYKFARRVSASEIIRQMVSQFRVVYEESFHYRAAEMGMTEREVIILASIIEKETAAAQERGLISAVFHNRLKQKMPLQSDPTVIFGLENFTGNLTRKDLETPSPYNTYLNKGFPLGPIANPGRAALVAALYPEAVDYLYFVSKNNGTHHFSVTLPEHNEAVSVYQRKGNRRL